jgi:N-6 DNA Methylase
MTIGEMLLDNFGPGSPLTREGVSLFARLLYQSDDRRLDESLAIWRESFTSSGHFWLDIDDSLYEQLADHVGVSGDVDRGHLLLAIQTYFVVVAAGLADRMMSIWHSDAWVDAGGPDQLDRLLLEEPFDWIKPFRQQAEFLAWKSKLDERLLQLGPTDLKFEDPLGGWYETLLPRALRHRLGEYYTPAWLVEHILDQLRGVDDPGVRILDPTCGSGIFLLGVIGRRRQAEEIESKSKVAKNRFAQKLSNNVCGFDLNPVAVAAARANWILAIGDLLDPAKPLTIPVYRRDSILGPTDQRPFDLIVGNPPWIAWDHLPQPYREATGPLWREYGLFSLNGNQARHGGAKKDLAMLMIYRCVDRYLRDGGQLGMVVTQSVFQNRHSGDGFRRFQLGENGHWLKVQRVDDLTARSPFRGASTRTATLVLCKGTRTEYPVDYWVWPKKCDDSPTLHKAAPIDPKKPGSAWSIREVTDDATFVPSGPSDYQAHLGVNTGGANGIYWVELLGSTDQGISIRNRAALSKKTIPICEAVVERELLYPLIRWGDLDRWRGTARGHIILAQDPDRRVGIEQSRMEKEYPSSLAFLKNFESILSERAAYRRYQQRHPFYSMYNVGQYSIAPVRVAWRRMDKKIRAAVLLPIVDPVLGPRPPLVQETCVLIATDMVEEAYYLAALLNSESVHRQVAAHMPVGSKSFGTPGMLDHLAIRQFDTSNLAHLDLAELGREAHELVARGAEPGETEKAIDRVVADYLKKEYTAGS